MSGIDAEKEPKPTFLQSGTAKVGHLTDINHPFYRLTEPLRVQITYEDDSYIVSDEESDSHLFVYADNEDLALALFRIQLITHREAVGVSDPHPMGHAITDERKFWRSRMALIPDPNPTISA